MSSLIPDDPTTQNEVETRGAEEEDSDLTIKFKLDDSIQSESSISDSTKLTIPVDSEAAGEEIKITKVNISDCNKEENAKQAKESIWVSNLNRDVKAVDVKEVFSKVAKVQGVKILTNNSNYFAYVTLKDAEQVAQCIEKLNNIVLNGEKIFLSATKPCLQAETNVKKKEDNKDLLKEDIKVAAETSNKGKTGKYTSEIIKTDKDSDPSHNSIIAEQKREIKRLKQELKIVDNKNSSLKSDLRAERRKYDTVYSKYQNLRRDMEKMENENRQKRRKLILDQENFEHSIKMKMVDVEKLKLDLNRQLEETKQLKERLSKEVNKLNDMKNVNTYKRTRSPSRRGRDSTSHIGQQQGKKFRYFHDFDKSKTPPPPNLRNESGKQTEYIAASSSNQAPGFSRGMKPPGTGFNRHEKSTTFQQSIHPGPRANTSNLDQRRPNTSNLDQRRANPSNLDQRRVNNYDYGAYSASQPYANALPVRGNNDLPYYQY